MTRILCIGEAMVELSAEGDLWRLGIAGDTLNTAWYLRRLLGPLHRVGYLSRVGTGEFSRHARRFMEEAGIDTTHLAEDPTREIGLYAITLTEGERSFSYWRDTSAAKRLADDPGLLAAALADCDLAYLSGITLAILPQAGRDALLAALAAAQDAGCTIVFDPNLRPRLWPGTDVMCTEIMRMAALADLVLPSFDDEAVHFGDADAAATIARYLGAGAGHVVVKNGGGPVAFGGRDGDGTVGDLPRERPIDSTAAGDSFNAGYIAARLDGQTPVDAIRAAHSLSRRVIAHRGALVPDAV
ncbi:sugar kinase [Halodurantibacterium flavum]|uniref:Sugar kinase n=1 Tax=Halodurantibacterium flavum TaxID=1382802 RepID=A0ABW4S1K8_9RHOB